MIIINLSLFTISLCCILPHAWCIASDEIDNNQEALTKPSVLGFLPHKSLLKEEKRISASKNEVSSEVFVTQPLTQENSLNDGKGISDSSKDKQIISSNDQEFYLFEQKELDAQEPGLGLYEALSPMLSPEMKKDAKKAWSESVDFREAIKLFTMEKETQEVVLKKSSSEMIELKGKTLEELSNKNLPSGIYDNKEPDEAMIKELFDSFYDLLINALLIIASVLILGKIISHIVKKVISGIKQQKKRRVRRHSHSKRRRKRRRRTYA